MVIAKQLIEEINGFVTDEPLVFRSDKRVPGLAGEPRQDLVVLRVQLDVILVQVFEEFLGSKDLGDLHQLIGVAVAVEERFLAEDHRGEHRTQRPHIERIVILLEVDKELRTLEIS